MKLAPLIVTLCLLMAAQRSAEAAEGADVEGDLLLAAVEQVAQIPSFEAKLRQRVFLFDQELVGSGVYRQHISNGLPMLRLEIRLQGEGRMTSLQQVSDGRTLWIRQDTGEEVRLSYVNLRTVQNVLHAASPTAKPPQVSGLNRLMVGGLPQLVTELQQHFEFASPQEATLGELPVWVLTGTWKRSALERLYPNGIPPAAAWPPQLPEQVSVTLGRDRQLPYFPYRIIYTRRERTPQGGPTEKLIPIAATEFFEVRPRPDLDARHFSYQPNDQEVIDATDQFIRRLSGRVGP